MRPTIAIVGLHGDPTTSPRRERVRELTSALGRSVDVVLLTNPSPASASSSRPSRSRCRAVGNLARTLLLDAHEPRSIRLIVRWQANVDAALLIGFPFSPLYWAARRAVHKRVPYVVDVGDPWILTAGHSPPPTLATLRARRAERYVWQHAAGGILTTDMQAASIAALFPSLPLLVQPNGYLVVDRGATLPPHVRNRPHPHAERRLRLVHYGNLYAPRLDVSAFLRMIGASGLWPRIEFTLYGQDWQDSLANAGPTVSVAIRPPLPWGSILADAHQHDVALVVGNRSPSQLPSKAIQYLTLPIPRAALVSGEPSDALTAYVSDKPGWITIPEGTDPHRSALRLQAHAARFWSDSELAPPASESWQAVSERILAFVLAQSGRRVIDTGDTVRP